MSRPPLEMASAMASMARAICGSAFSTAPATVLSSLLMTRAISSADLVSSSVEATFACSVRRCLMLIIDHWSLIDRFDDRVVERRPDLLDGLRAAVWPGAVG